MRERARSGGVYTILTYNSVKFVEITRRNLRDSRMISVVLNPLFVLQRGVPPCNSVEIVGSQPGNLTQFAARVLLRDSPQGRRARGLVKVDQEGGAIANLALRVAAMLLESPWPSVSC